MNHLVDIESWERRDNYNFFQPFFCSWYSITTEIDCTEASNTARTCKDSFFLYYSYALLRAVNEIKELRYRKDNDGNVVLYDIIDIISPIAVPGKTFSTIRIPYNKDFKEFYKKGLELISSVPDDACPYVLEQELISNGDYGVILLSATPKLYFTSLTSTLYKPGGGCKYPLLSIGKVVPREGNLVFPLAIYIDHAFVDGEHLSTLAEKMEIYLKEISAQ